jgi:beta-phosphoglucomutase-like phosphatase (HAD superfamily)
MSVVGEPRAGLYLDRLAADWQLALDAAQSALESSDDAYEPVERQGRRGLLEEERRLTAGLLEGVGRVDHVAALPWLSPVPVTAPMLGLELGTEACIFDLDGVLTDSGRAHATAWAEVFDDFLLRHTEATGWQFIPFDRGADYRAYLDGRPRLDGIHVFLASRGIHLPEGRPDDASRADTAHGLARRKEEALARVLRHGVSALDGAHRYLEAAGHAGVARGVVSGSQSTAEMLELAGLSTLVDVSIDAGAIDAMSLRSRPAPDVLVAVCARLGVEPAAAMTFTHSAAGVAAGHAAGLGVVGVGDEATLERLRGFGAERVVPSLSTLLDRRLQTVR